ncbi:MAG: glycosyl hydrolase [Rhodanobacter sp.]|nr:MAG: glycosyl hydrolase [Rhodanobacter sp.]
MKTFGTGSVVLILVVAWVGMPACFARAVSPEQRADAIIKKMTLDEKISQLHGVTDSRHDRWVPGIPRLGIPPLPMANGPAGIGPAGLIQPRATAFPAPIAVAATWDRADAREYGVAVASEIRDIGRTMLEAPTVNIARIPTSGRTFEAYGEDPFLTGELAAANIEGIQSRSVIANVKHFALNNQEDDRQFVDANADERTMREIYFPPFEKAVKEAHVASLMCAYNRVNGPYACENKTLLTDVLRHDWHFDGFVVSDFGAAHDGLKDADAGMDLEMPTGETYDAKFKALVRDGRIPMSRIDTMLRHRYSAMIRLGLFDQPLPAEQPIPETKDGKVAEQLASDAMVLLKNQGDLLPIRSANNPTIAVIGPAADTLLEGGGAASVLALHTISPIAAMRARFGAARIRYVPVGGVGFIDPRATLDGWVLSPPSAKPGVHGVLAEYFDNTHFAGKPRFKRIERIPEVSSEFGTPIAGLPIDYSLRWTADLVVPVTGTYTLGTEAWGNARLLLDGKVLVDAGGHHTELTPKSATVHLQVGHTYRLQMDYVSHARSLARVLWTWPKGMDEPGTARAVAAARHADIAVVFAGAWSHEGYDRASLALPGAQDRLIEAVAAANPHTVVVVQSGNAVLMPWLHEVAGVLDAWFPGEEGGAAIAGILAGDHDPSGKLPLTFPAANGQVAASTPAQYPGIDHVEHYSEGLRVGYRWYDATGHKPLFPFGFGLSYTHFGFTDMDVTPQHDGSVIVHATVTNQGARAGAEVAQVYVGYPAAAGEPPVQLRGFAKVHLAAGASKQLKFVLPPRAFSSWSVAKHGWAITPGSYTVAVGDSSRDLPLRQQVSR